MDCFAQPRETTLVAGDRKLHALAINSSHQLLPQRKHGQRCPISGDQRIGHTSQGLGRVRGTNARSHQVQEVLSEHVEATWMDN